MPNRPWRWSEQARRYRAPNGRFLSGSQVRQAIDAALATAQQRVTGLSEQLRARALDVGSWERAMRQELKRIHVYSGLLAKGGRAQLTPAETGRIGAELKAQYGLLRTFADQIVSGVQPLDGRFVRRTQMYAAAGRATMEAVRTRDLLAAGFTEIRSRLTPADHCAECVEQHNRDWQDTTAFVPLGHRQCLTGCRCVVERRNPATGEIAA